MGGSAMSQMVLSMRRISLPSKGQMCFKLIPSISRVFCLVVFLCIVYQVILTVEYVVVRHNGYSSMLMLNVKSKLKLDDKRANPSDLKAYVCSQTQKKTYSNGNGHKFCGSDLNPSLLGRFENVGVSLQEDTCTGPTASFFGKGASSTYGKHQVNLNVNDFLDAPVRLKYSYLTVLPQGLQDNGGGYLDGNLISVGGFCGGNDAFGYPYCCGKRGFLDNAWYLPLKEDSKNSANQCWKDLPQFPGKARQGLNCVSNEGKKELYCWAGISYTPLKAKEKDISKLHSKKADPYGYVDGFKLSSSSKGKFEWSKLPDLPSSQSAFNQLIMCDDDDSSLYLFGGADYDSNQFHTSKDRNGANKGLGSYLWKFSISKAKGDDVRPSSKAWTRLPNLPGTPRFIVSASCTAGNLYVIGGATEGTSYGDDNTFKTVLDNWKFSIKANKWSRLADTPAMFGNFRAPNKVYKGRYIFLVGGYGYKTGVVNNVIKTREELGYEGMPYLDASVNFMQYSNGVMVYDVLNDKFFWTDPLPINNNYPLVVIADDDIYIIGGETGGGCVLGKPTGRHSDLVLKAGITLKSGT